MVGFKITTNALDTAEAFQRLQAFVPGAVGATVQRTANSIQGRAQTLAPYRTGAYRNSIRTELISRGAYEFYAEIGSDLDYGYRLEQGYTGTDDTGRPVHQSPHPHFGPAVDEFEPIFVAEVTKIVTGSYV